VATIASAATAGIRRQPLVRAELGRKSGARSISTAPA
jgi:hypothetical protein